MFFENKQLKGFTLIEMLIVMIIVGIIMMIGFTVLERTIPIQRANRVTLRIVGEIERARTMSALNQSTPGKIHPPKGGFGIYFDRKTYPQSIRYVLFADVDESGCRDYGDEDVGSMRLIEGVKIAEVRIGVNGWLLGPNESVSILFRPYWRENERIVMILETEDGIERQIKINRAGTISFGN